MNRALLLLPLLGLSVTGNDRPGQSATDCECRWCDAAVTVDARINEPAWRHAQVLDHFRLGADAGPARAQTKARLLWDREFLYLFAEMEDHDIQADEKSSEAPFGKRDAVALLLKPAEDRPGYHELQIDPAGRVFERFMAKRSKTPPAFPQDPTRIEVKVRVDGKLNNAKDRDRGWTIEARIPWTSLLRMGGRPEPGETWRFALVRCDSSTDKGQAEISSSAPLKSDDLHSYEDYATVCFRAPDARTAKPFGIVKRTPLTTSTVVGSPDPPLPFQVKRAYPKLKMNYPIAVVHQLGSDRILFIASERSSGATRIRRVKDDPNVTLEDSEVLLDFDYTAYDIAFHPKFAKNGYVYVGSNGPQSGPGKDRKTRVTRYTISPTPPYALGPKSEKLIIDWHSDGHNGGALAFGHDGMLYVTSGDGTSDSDTTIVGQDMTTLLAKVLRIDVDHPDPGKAYSVPKDNPFVNLPGARPEIWAYGLRNPWRMTVDKKTGHIWVAQNGQDLWEQAYLVTKGDNYGWSVYEGSYPFYPNRKLGPTPHVKPTLEHPHSEARSLTGGIVYYGSKYPELQGAYIYGDYSTGRIWAAKHDGTKLLWHKELVSTRLQITGFGTDSTGEILIADHRDKKDGAFYTLVPTPKERAPSSFPKKLSDSGLFRSVKGHVVEPALIPYSVGAPFWSDGVLKERWLALPGADSTIEFTRSRGWNLPDQTVIVKSFAFDMEEGNPASRRWIETRFLTKQGEWYGYSYEWNDEQTEAVLVPAGGKDREFTIKTRDNVRKQVWHYPSRTECMVCHSRAANFVLGLSEEQMNKEHDYGGMRDNQLRVLEHLGVLRVNWYEEARQALRDEAKAKGLKPNDLVNRLQPGGDQRQPKTSSLLTFAPEKYRRLVDPHDRTQDLNLRARSYLHSNCAQCHVEAGGGNAQMQLEFVTPLEKMNIIDVKPLHHTFDLKDARLVAPGHPERSTLLYRLTHRGGGQMPPLSTRLVDRAAVEMLEEWIRQMKR